MMDDFRFVRCLNCGREKNPRKPCFNCGDKVSATMPVTTRAVDAELTAAKARIAELEEALEPFARWYLHGVFPSKQELQSAAAALLKDK